MTRLQLEPSAHAPWTRTMEGFVADTVSDFAATTYAGISIRARIANGTTFFIIYQFTSLADGSSLERG